MGASQLEAEKVAEQKLKYWVKVLSEDAIDANTWRMFDTFDWASFWSDWILSDTLFSTLVSMLLFDIPLSDVVPWLLNWGIELPTTDEFLRGVLIKLESIDITQVFPELASIFDTVWTLFQPEFAENIAGTKLEKAIYGQSRYDESYYDPEAVREFLRSTLYAFTKKDVSWSEARTRVERVAQQLGIPEDLARSVFDRLSMITAVKEKAATWDYAWWDKSDWSLEGSGGQVVFVTWDLTEEAVEYEQLFDPQACGVWDYTCWDYSYWTPAEPVYLFDVEKLRAAYDTFRDFVVQGFRNRYLATALAAANYQTAEERRTWSSGRTETYALPMSQRYRIESIVENVVKSKVPDINPFKLRLYKSAALDIYGSLYGVHRWGSEMQRAMSADEMRQYWINKWSADGLDPDVLSAIWDNVKPVIDILGNVHVSARLRFIREKLAATR
jgi:hypothetical protein